jgi:Zn-dependent protease with chaperone function
VHAAQLGLRRRRQVGAEEERSSTSVSGIPPDLQAQYEAIVSRATTAGRPLRPVPLLEASPSTRRASRVAGTRAAPRVQLSRDLLEADPADRAFVIAHELSHVLRWQCGERVDGRPVLPVASGLAGAGVGGVIGVLLGPPSLAGLFAAIALAGVAGMWLVLLAVIRREEAAADVTAATVFREVLSAAGVSRLRRGEGWGSRFVPTLLRSHPHPQARRRAGQAARAALDEAGDRPGCPACGRARGETAG